MANVIIRGYFRNTFLDFFHINEIRLKKDYKIIVKKGIIQMMLKNINFKKTFIGNLFLITLIGITTNVYAHEHTGDCYGGTLHTCQGDLTNGGACYSQVAQNCLGTMTYTEESKTTSKCASCSAEIQGITFYTVKCSACPFSGKAVDQPSTCPSCGANLGLIEGYIKFGSTCPQTYNVYQKTCNKTTGKYYNSQGQYLNPSCNYVIVSITPKVQNQVTDNPDFTIIATYLDGHTQEKQPTKVDYSPNKKYNNSSITISYSGIVTRAGNQGTLTTSITLSSPTPITTPTPTPTKVTTPTPTQVITPTPTTIITPTTLPTQQITPIAPTQSVENQQTSNQEITNENNDEVNVEITTGFAHVPEVTKEPEKVVINNNNKGNKDVTNMDSVYYDSDENEGVEEEREYLKIEKKEKEISLAGILLIVFAILFGIIFAIYIIITITKHIVNKNKTVTQINLNDYIRR